MSYMKEAIGRVVALEDFSEADIRSVMMEIMEGRSTDAQTASFLTAMRMKGETVEEITGAARVMREKVISIAPDLAYGEPLIDTCGTGGDGADTFNVSTTVAFVVAGAGVKVAKHGNRAVSSRSGSADLLETLGVDITIPPERVKEAIEEVGIGFLFAPALHPAMKHAIGPRREMGIRTIFNVLGPLTNPAGANCQLMGVFMYSLTHILAEVLGRLGSRRAWVVHGHGGMDELSLTGPSSVSEWTGSQVRDFKLMPEECGLSLCRAEDIKGGTPEENAGILKAVLSGAPGARRDICLLNAGAALVVAGLAEDLTEGVALAAHSVDSGSAMKRLDRLVEFCREGA